MLRVAWIVLVVALGIFLGGCCYLLTRPPNRKAATDLGSSAGMITVLKKSAPIPVRLKIAKIKVDAAIEQMGLTIGGDMDAPAGPRTVGWYRYGPAPGEIGSAVLDGHYGTWKNGERSVFDNLGKLKKGDVIEVVDAAGASFNFAVRESRNYLPEADATAVFKSSDGLAHLNIITCEGTYNPKTKTYSQRLVVFADKI